MSDMRLEEIAEQNADCLNKVNYDDWQWFLFALESAYHLGREDAAKIVEKFALEEHWTENEISPAILKGDKQP